MTIDLTKVNYGRYLGATLRSPAGADRFQRELLRFISPKRLKSHRHCPTHSPVTTFSCSYLYSDVKFGYLSVDI